MSGWVDVEYDNMLFVENIGNTKNIVHAKINDINFIT